jgi:uncharacterized membrane protein YgdD (TMEM256/DUF423 family)
MTPAEIRLVPHAHSFLLLGCVLMALATAMGASGAHLLEDQLTPTQMANYLQAVHYHFFQALGLMLIAGLAQLWPDSRGVKFAGWAVVVGVALFSGTIYARTFGAPQGIAIIAMFGGIAFQVAWWTLAVVVWKRGR